MEQIAELSTVVQPDLFIEAVQSYGVNRGRGNLVGIQPYMTAVHYATADQFHSHLDGYLAAAQAEGWLHTNTIVIFPENIGTWLLVVDEHASVHQAETTAQASKCMVRHNLPRFLATLLQAKGQNRSVDALFRMKAHPMAHIYQETFAHLARHYGVTIVAGSIFLPEPTIVDGRLQPGAGWLQNVTCVFDGDGRIHPHITRKNTPVFAETGFLKAGTPADLPVYDTSVGRLGVLICADSWYPAAYETLAAQDVDIIAIPNNQEHWGEPWPGYRTAARPSDFDPQDVGAITESQAWLKYALPGRIGLTNAVAGMHVFFHGRMWDQIGDGQTIIVHDGVTYAAPHVAKAALVNLWL